jgi:hypothetical protein
VNWSHTAIVPVLAPASPRMVSSYVSVTSRRVVSVLSSK